MTHETLWLISAIIITGMAMGWMALSKPTHWKQVEKNAPAVTRLRVAGWIALLLSAICSLKADHASMAVLVWLMLISAASISTGMVLSMKPSWLRILTFCWLSPAIFTKR